MFLIHIFEIILTWNPDLFSFCPVRKSSKGTDKEIESSKSSGFIKERSALLFKNKKRCLLHRLKRFFQPIVTPFNFNLSLSCRRIRFSTKHVWWRWWRWDGGRNDKQSNSFKKSTPVSLLFWYFVDVPPEELSSYQTTILNDVYAFFSGYDWCCFAWKNQRTWYTRQGFYYCFAHRGYRFEIRFSTECVLEKNWPRSVAKSCSCNHIVITFTQYSVTIFSRPLFISVNIFFWKYIYLLLTPENGVKLHTTMYLLRLSVIAHRLSEGVRSMVLV